MSGRRSHSMEYEDPLDSSGTDDDLPPTHSAGGRASRGVRVSGNGRAATGVIYASSQPSTSTVDHMIHRLEQEAYTAVLRAFGAQSELITWDKERLMTDLRKELRVTDEQHREFLVKVGHDDAIKQIQQLSATQPAIAPVEVSPPPPVPSHSRKKQKTALLTQAALPPSSSAPAAPSHLKSGPVQSTSGSKRPGPNNGPRGKKQKVQGRGSSSMKGHGGSKAGRPPSTKVSDNPPEVSIDPYIGKRVKTRWPDDNAFYEALITDYNPDTGLHALVYDMDTANETWEWIDLKEVPPSDLKWVEGPNAVIGRKAPPPGAARGGMGRGMKRGPKGSVASPGGKARGGGTPKMRGWRGPASGENGSRSSLGLIPIEDLAKEVDKLEEDEDLSKLEDAKKAAKAHEENIRRQLAQVGESSDEAESDDAGQPPSSHTQSVDHDREQRGSAQNSRDHPNADSDEEETAGNERAEAEADASDGEHTGGEGGAASDAYDDQHGDDGDDKDEDG